MNEIDRHYEIEDAYQMDRHSDLLGLMDIDEIPGYLEWLDERLSKQWKVIRHKHRAWTVAA